VKVIPVIDVLDGVAVHAVKGERKLYKPLRSIIAISSDPLETAKAFHGAGFSELYVADLNGIIGDGDNLDVIGQISRETGLKLMVDAGVADIEKAKKVLEYGASSAIIGTETMTRIDFVEEAVSILGADHVLVSLDLKHGQLLAKFSGEKHPNLRATLQEFQQMGVKRIIMLDLARVGSEEGVDISLLSGVVKGLNVDVFVGGGVRSIEDLQQLNDVGVAGVLLATALHSGRITPEQISERKFSLA
jgi:phosphoribosylformimino-5-aminoimidazole carboxamide ribotide isomerase